MVNIWFCLNTQFHLFHSVNYQWSNHYCISFKIILDIFKDTRIMVEKLFPTFLKKWDYIKTYFWYETVLDNKETKIDTSTGMIITEPDDAFIII